MFKSLSSYKFNRLLMATIFACILLAFGPSALGSPNSCKDMFLHTNKAFNRGLPIKAGLKLFEFYSKDTPFDFFSFSEGQLSGFSMGQWTDLGPAIVKDGLITLTAKVTSLNSNVLAAEEVQLTDDQAKVYFKATELKPLSDQNRNALTLFAQGRMDTPINLILRKASKANDLTPEQVATAQRLIQELDQAFSYATPLPLGLNLHRGISNHSIYGALKKSDLFTDEGFSSTSIDPNVALRFAKLALSKADSTPNLIQTMVIKISSEMVLGQYIPLAVGSMFDGNEFEVLINRGQKFKVIEVTERKAFSGDTFRTITVETQEP